MSLTRAHDQRLRALYRSAGWPCLDAIEVDLLAAGLIERVQPATGPEHLRLTQAGIERLSAALQRNRRAFDAHEALVERVAEEQLRQGRIAWRALSLLARPAEAWLQVRPDVYSIRNTTVEDYVEPVIHEIKVRRADLQSDLKKPDKWGAYVSLSAECWYVLAEGIGVAEEVPPDCGVMMLRGEQLELLRPAPRRVVKLGFSHWMALAKSDRYRSLSEPEPSL